MKFTAPLAKIVDKSVFAANTVSLPIVKTQKNIRMLNPADIQPLSGDFTCRWASPSNIAIVKYWGKKDGQLPANPSVSFTLDACRTDTSLKVKTRGDRNSKYAVEVYLDGEEKPSFVPKIEQFFDRIAPYAPYLADYAFTVHTSNSFPHSSGIASSASGMSALAVCLVNFENACGADYTPGEFLRRASFYARLGSGSAARSIYGGAVAWGESPAIPGSSDLYAVPLPPENIHPVFRDFRDTVLLVEKGSKSVSSSAGHALMKGHPFAPARFSQAGEHTAKLLDILRGGEVQDFGTLAESEALTLHAMMMTADPYYILFKPATLQALQKVWDFRRETGQPLYFTLDAGANVHLLYPAEAENTIRRFIADELSPLSGGSFIDDRVGPGPRKIG